MQRMDLAVDELAAFHATLRSSHTRRVRASVLDLEGGVISDLSGRVVDGEVVVDMDAEVTRSLTMTVSDPHHSLNFDTDSPDDGAVYADRMVRVYYSVLVDSLGRHVSAPVFTGPVTKLARSGDVVTLEAQGKEALASGPVWRPITLKKGLRKTAAIRTLMRERSGESAFDIADLDARLPKAVSLGRFDPAWPLAQRIAGGMDRQLFYPGTGRLTLRPLPDRPVYTFRGGTGGDVVSGVEVSHLLDDVKNAIFVQGGKPKGAKSPVQAQAVAEPAHPLSPQRLGRGGVPRFLAEKIEDDTIRSRREADLRARRVLQDRLRSVVEVAFDTLPVPHLDPGDLVRVETGDLAAEFRVRQFTIPLGVEGAPTMSVGYHRRTTINWKRIRR